MASESNSIEKLTSIGASVDIESGHATRVCFEECVTVDFEDLACVAALPKLQDIRFYGTPLTGELLDRLCCHGTLECLGLSGTTLSPEEITRISRFSKLKFVDLSNTQADDAVIQSLLRSASTLTHLHVCGTTISPNSTTQLVSKTRLQSLWIGGRQISRESLLAVASKSLNELHIGGGDVTDTCLPCVPCFQQLDYLAIVNSAITDAGLASLPNIGAVRSLILNGNPRLTNACCNRIQGIDGVESISFAVTNVSSQAKARLRRRFPTLQVGP